MWSRSDADGAMTAAQQTEMSVIPASRFVAIEPCGHMLTLEQPDVLTRLLAGWLAAPS
jgi:pimeloyl-ACP methyl ester carboxylesterase